MWPEYLFLSHGHGDLSPESTSPTRREAQGRDGDRAASQSSDSWRSDAKGRKLSEPRKGEMGLRKLFVCERGKPEVLWEYGELQEGMWEKIQMDFVSSIIILLQGCSAV